MSMGKSWNKLGRKGHRHERAQPESRRHLGFLEHHRDYVQRAKDYHKKEDELNHLRLLASMKNPDEFHSDMVHTKVFNGRMIVDKESKLNPRRLKEIREGDHKYILMQLQHEQNKLKRELGSFHCVDAADLSVDHDNDRKKSEIEIIESSNSKLDVLNEKALITAKASVNKKADHIIFVDGNEERCTFDASKYFKTPKQLLAHKHNRLKTSQLATGQIKMDPERATKLKKQTLLKYWQIQGRIHKLENIKKYQHHLNLKRKIKSGDKFLVYKKRDVNSGKIVKKRYKWIKQRKR
eukprot:CAMPEP_0202712124 /NCGR_PEP_ID=MMETSP1385-20130828/33416_1 /ASSEMBLY_ACC=CAM_ASM_000861 /TAXON_ID=933848 /ORGANISM="Elphidium margaritaceum" /LENGTH=293 /DNA_ID=CAMNT_0049372061 /DNA_START=40 /DNA_END=921 /DNA_ORIENTATION=-